MRQTGRPASLLGSSRVFDAFIAYHARQQPERNAIVVPGGSLTFAELDTMVDRFTRALGELGVEQDAVVSVRFANPVTHWIVLLALSRLGIASACAADPAASFRISDQAPAPDAAGAFHASPDWIASASSALVGPLRPARPARPAPGRLGRVLLSSGTTGVQKRIPLSWALVDANVRNAVIAYGPVGGGPWLLEPGIDTALGFTVTLAAWAAGHGVLFRGDWDLAAVFVRSPPGLLGIVPAQLQRLLAQLPRRFGPLPAMRLVVAGGLLPPDLARKARLRLTPDVRTVYGASECGAATIADAALLDEHPGAAGYPMPGVNVEVVDGEGQPVPGGAQGEVRIGSGRVAGRYLGPEPDERAFRDGWFYPGDLGRLLADGLLLIDGRIDDLMNLGGTKLLPSAVEAALQGCPGVVEAAAFAVPDAASGLDQCWLAVVRDAGFDKDAVAACLASGLPWVPPVQLVFLDRLPRNMMGKVERGALAAAARSIASPRS